MVVVGGSAVCGRFFFLLPLDGSYLTKRYSLPGGANAPPFSRAYQDTPVKIHLKGELVRLRTSFFLEAYLLCTGRCVRRQNKD